ncbi:hypothetical protein B0H13DRAFT_2392830 [Mycena leptocephala]|nr:hypothetical protein B0H13DRAFT_2392830 [Mycena leptocephala]
MLIANLRGDPDSHLYVCLDYSHGHSTLEIVPFSVGMISSVDQHHHGGPTSSPAPIQHFSDDYCAQDELPAHYRHLESLLDLALATLTLIRDNTSSPIFTPHLVGVLRLLNRDIAKTSPPLTAAASAASAGASPRRRW